MRADERDELSEDLSAYLDGALSGERAAEIERVLASSPEAREALAALRAVADALRTAPRHAAPHDLGPLLRARVAARPRNAAPAPRGRRLLLRLAGFTSLAASLFLAGFVARGLWQPTRRAPAGFAEPIGHDAAAARLAAPRSAGRPVEAPAGAPGADELAARSPAALSAPAALEWDGDEDADGAALGQLATAGDAAWEAPVAAGTLVAPKDLAPEPAVAVVIRPGTADEYEQWAALLGQSASTLPESGAGLGGRGRRGAGRESAAPPQQPQAAQSFVLRRAEALRVLSQAPAAGASEAAQVRLGAALDGAASLGGAALAKREDEKAAAAERTPPPARERSASGASRDDAPRLAGRGVARSALRDQDQSADAGLQPAAPPPGGRGARIVRRELARPSADEKDAPATAPAEQPSATAPTAEPTAAAPTAQRNAASPTAQPNAVAPAQSGGSQTAETSLGLALRRAVMSPDDFEARPPLEGAPLDARAGGATTELLRGALAQLGKWLEVAGRALQSKPVSQLTEDATIEIRLLPPAVEPTTTAPDQP